MIQGSQPKIKVMLMDVGNVMVRLKTPQLFAALAEHCSGLDEATIKVALREDNKGLHIAYEKGRVNFDEFHADFVSRYGMSYSRDAFLAVWKDYFLPNRPMEALVARVGKQVQWWGLSNTNQVHHDHFCRIFRVFDTFERVIGSHQLGLRKPDAQIFKKALSIIGVSASEILFVDDYPPNVEAARELGFKVFNYRWNDLDLQKVLLNLGLQLPSLGGRSGMVC